MLNNARMGRTNIIPTIIMGNIEMELPTIYIIKRFIGTCLKKMSRYVNLLLFAYVTALKI